MGDKMTKNSKNSIFLIFLIISITLQFDIFSTGESWHALYDCSYLTNLNGTRVRKVKNNEGKDLFVLDEDDEDIDLEEFELTGIPIKKIVGNKGDTVDFAVEQHEFKLIPCSQKFLKCIVNVDDVAEFNNYCTNERGGKVSIIADCHWPKGC